MEKISSKNARLKRSREYAGLSQEDFALKIGVSQGYVGQLEKDKGFSLKQAERFAEILGVNPKWLYFGDSDQFGGNNASEAQPQLLPSIEQQHGVPYYDIDVTASIVGSFNDLNERPEFFVDFRPFNDCKAWMPIYGDSMFPRFQSGEIVAIKQVNNMEGIQWGEAHLVITDSTYDLRTVKTIHPYEKDDSKIILRATNPNYKGDTIITKSSILSLYIVKGKVTRFQI